MFLFFWQGRLAARQILTPRSQRQKQRWHDFGTVSVQLCCCLAELSHGYYVFCCQRQPWDVFTALCIFSDLRKPIYPSIHPSIHPSGVPPMTPSRDILVVLMTRQPRKNMISQGALRITPNDPYLNEKNFVEVPSSGETMTQSIISNLEAWRDTSKNIHFSYKLSMVQMEISR